MLQGRTYLCKKLDLGQKVATVRAADLKYYTKTRDFTDVHVVGGHTAYPVMVWQLPFAVHPASSMKKSFRKSKRQNNCSKMHLHLMQSVNI